MMRIGVATGGSAHSDIAVRLAGVVAQATGGSLLVFTVIRHENGQSWAARILDNAVALLKLPAEQVETAVSVGRPDQQIALVAQKQQLDLLVVGDRPAHRLVSRLFGPLADKVIAGVECPVLVARQVPDRPGRLLLCEGGRYPSLLDRMMDRLRPLLAAAEEVTVLHVMSQMAAAPGVERWELHAEARALMAGHSVEGEWLAHDAEMLATLPPELHTRVRHGLVLDEILAEISEGGYDLAVIGKHESSGWERYLLDDLAHQIVAGADISVLVI